MEKEDDMMAMRVDEEEIVAIVGELPYIPGENV